MVANGFAVAYFGVIHPGCGSGGRCLGRDARARARAALVSRIVLVLWQSSQSS